MGGHEVRTAQKDRYAAIIDQDDVTEEVRNIALKYDPVNRAGQEGFHVTENGELHIDDEKVIEEHRIIENRIPWIDGYVQPVALAIDTITVSPTAI